MSINVTLDQWIITISKKNEHLSLSSRLDEELNRCLVALYDSY